MAIRAAMNAIQPMLMMPSAKSAAMSIQQQPTQKPPCSSPIRSAPTRPGCECERKNIIGLRQ